MAKPNVNTASRDDLVEAGVRAEIADEILKLRRKGKISPEALDQVLTDLVREQTRHNLEALSALTRAVDWDQVTKAINWDRVFQLQGEYLRASLERGAQLTQRYLEVTQAVMTAAANTTRDRVRKVA